MERRLDQELEAVRQDLLRIGATVEEMVAGSVQSLVERDSDAAEAIIARDQEVDRMEMHLDKKCEQIMATQQPTAGDLRFLVAVLKINGELERIGDSAVNISQSVLRLIDEPQLKPYIDLPRLDELVQGMVHDALAAFVNRDAPLAVQVCDRDDQVDGLYKQLFRELVSYMAEDPTTVSRALSLLLIARNLERIADHATNIGEDVVFYVEGRDIRHPKLDQPADA
jgi:phosphate transport system protein